MSPHEFRKARKAIGNQSAIASMLGVTRRTICRYESGEQGIPRAIVLAMERLAQLIDN